jgi:glycosyltransferase involved in cell wall biosynthesis
LPGFDVIRCWKFGSATTPLRILKAIRRLQPDVVWFNLVFSSFATPENPFAAFAGLSAPALVRASGFYTHITLHHIVEHVDFAAAGVRRERIVRMGSAVATRALLKAHSVSVLLSRYRRTLITKYSAQNVLLGTHGAFASVPSPPDFSKRGNPDLRILAIGHWGTYKRLETLMEAFPAVLKKIPNARLIVAGANHHTKAGYWESIREAQPPHLPIEFRGYVPEEDIPELFRSTSIVVMPYDSATGSSGPAHQACEYGIPIVCADIPEFREMVADEAMAAHFYRTGDGSDLADQLVNILQSPELQIEMAQRNYEAGLQMNMARVVGNYLRWFELKRCKRAILDAGEFSLRCRLFERPLAGKEAPAGWLFPSVFSRSGRDAVVVADGLEVVANDGDADAFADPRDWVKPIAAKGHSDGDGYPGSPTLESDF